VDHPIKVLVVTTFNLDEYVYEALQAWRRMRDSNSRGVAPNTLSKRAP
jgi:hypothetical protein